MISIEFSLDLYATPVGPSPMPLEAEVDLIMENLVGLVDTECGIKDPAISLDEANNLVTIDVTVEAVDFEAAVELASSCIRSAIHAAGGHTPDWNVEQRRQHAELVEA